IVERVTAGALDATVVGIRHHRALREGTEVAVLPRQIRELGIAAYRHGAHCHRRWGAWGCVKEMETGYCRDGDHRHGGDWQNHEKRPRPGHAAGPRRSWRPLLGDVPLRSGS